MKRTEAEILIFAELNLDGKALSEAALLGDWDEVRFRCHLVATGAADSWLTGAALTAAKLIDLLGTVSSKPCPGYGAVMRLLADELDVATRDDTTQPRAGSCD